MPTYAQTLNTYNGPFGQMQGKATYTYKNADDGMGRIFEGQFSFSYADVEKSKNVMLAKNETYTETGRYHNDLRTGQWAFHQVHKAFTKDETFHLETTYKDGLADGRFVLKQTDAVHPEFNIEATLTLKEGYISGRYDNVKLAAYSVYSFETDEQYRPHGTWKVLNTMNNEFYVEEYEHGKLKQRYNYYPDTGNKEVIDSEFYLTTIPAMAAESMAGLFHRAAYYSGSTDRSCSAYYGIKAFKGWESSVAVR